MIRNIKTKLLFLILLFSKSTTLFIWIEISFGLASTSHSDGEKHLHGHFYWKIMNELNFSVPPGFSCFRFKHINLEHWLFVFCLILTLDRCHCNDILYSVLFTSARGLNVMAHRCTYHSCILTQIQDIQESREADKIISTLCFWPLGCLEQAQVASEFPPLYIKKESLVERTQWKLLLAPECATARSISWFPWLAVWV